MAVAGTRNHGLFYGWVIVAASSLMNSIVYGCQYSFGVFFKPIQEDFGWNRTTVSGIYSTYYVVTGLLSVLMGWYGDKLGPRKVLSVTAIIGGAALALVGQTTSAWQLYLLYGVLFPLVASSVWIVVSSTTSRWFVRRRGLAIGIITAGTGVGTVFMPPLSRFLISSYDWRTAFTILGLALILIVFTCSQFLKREPTESDNARGWQAEKAIRVETPGITFSAALARRSLWVIAAMHFFTSLALQLIMTHLVNYATDKAITPVLAANFVSFLGGASVIGRLGMGAVSDRIGKRRSLVICTTLDALAILWLTQIGSPWMFIVFGLVFGFCFGGWVPMFPSLTAEVFGTSHLGAIYGVVAGTSGIGGLIGPLLAGYLFDLNGDYFYAFLSGAVAMLLAGVLSAFLEKAAPVKQLARAAL